MSLIKALNFFYFLEENSLLYINQAVVPIAVSIAVPIEVSIAVSVAVPIAGEELSYLQSLSPKSFLVVYIVLKYSTTPVVINRWQCLLQCVNCFTLKNSSASDKHKEPQIMSVALTQPMPENCLGFIISNSTAAFNYRH